MRTYAIIVLSVILFISCKKEESLKFSASDLFKKSIVKSQFFIIDLKKDTTIIGDKGTKIVIPKNAFIDLQGNIINKTIQFELSEALTLDEMILSNLTTISNSKLLQTDGMIFINATFNNENLKINKEKPLYIEIPTKNKQSNMMVYKGIRNPIGNINWINPKKMKQYLIPIDLELLDFLPKGFEQAAINYLSYYKTPITKKAIDSLYFSLSKKDLVKDSVFDLLSYGINPSEIQTIKLSKFNNTLIATKEFETRLPYLFKTCNDDNLRVYVENLNKNMWEADSIVLVNLPDKATLTQIRTEEYSATNGNLTINRERQVLDTIGYMSLKSIKEQFLKFKNQKSTNVKHKSVYISQLVSFYKKKLKENIRKTDSLREIALIREQNSAVRVVYRKLLEERKKIIMQTYGFIQTETGWINIDKGVIPKDWNYQKVNIKISKAVNFDQTHAYLVFSNIKSIVKLNELDKTHFEINNFVESIPITKDKKITTVVIAIKNDEYYFGKQDFISSKASNNDIKLNLTKSNFLEIKKAISKIKTTSESKDIIKELALSIEIKKQKILKQELLKAAFPCWTN
jgi:hypothetical protein